MELIDATYVAAGLPTRQPTPVESTPSSDPIDPSPLSDPTGD